MTHLRGSKMPVNANDEEYMITDLEQRADYISYEDIIDETATNGAGFIDAYKELTNKSLRTLVGPRGSGKTHLMRYIAAQSLQNSQSPFAVYVSFNKYFRLEPLRSTKPNSMELFHSWVLALILLSTYEVGEKLFDLQEVKNTYIAHEIDIDVTRSLVNHLERGQALSQEEEEISYLLSIDLIKKIIDEICRLGKKKFCILLLDDAALTLTPDYLIDFLDIVRALKSQSIAPKVSVYPGTTEYSSRFHSGQDSLEVKIWHSIDSDNYEEIMGAIAEKRISNLEDIPPEIVALFKYASFGIPRAFLSMLWSFQRDKSKTRQQAVNKIIQDYLAARLAEYNSLAKKVPKLATIIKHGEAVFSEMASEINEANKTSLKKGFKQIYVGVHTDIVTSFVQRMFGLLVEAGLLYEGSVVNHGNRGSFRRYTPHIAKLLDIRAFSNGRLVGHKHIVEALRFKVEKHPVRKSLNSLSTESINYLKVDLPQCTQCQTPRLNEEQRFCHNCGAKLVEPSVFSECCQIKIGDVPGVTAWQKRKIAEELPSFKTISDFMAKQDPGSELKKIDYIGNKRSTDIVKALESFIDEFLS